MMKSLRYAVLAFTLPSFFLQGVFRVDSAWACLNAMELEGVGLPYITSDSIPVYAIVGLAILFSVTSPIWFYRLVMVKAKGKEGRRRGAKAFDIFLLLLTLGLSLVCCVALWFWVDGVLRSAFPSDRLVLWGILFLCLSLSLFGASKKSSPRHKAWELLVLPWTILLSCFAFVSMLF